MSGIVLNAGALIALERNDRSFWAVLKLAALKSDDAVQAAKIAVRAAKIAVRCRPTLPFGRPKSPFGRPTLPFGVGQRCRSGGQILADPSQIWHPSRMHAHVNEPSPIPSARFDDLDRPATKRNGSAA